ncbi:DsbA family oxidoreductase [Catenuloplanes atrovinosus]|uniref:DsbA family oxidoreductase n=1 Tax=Catenuloplanes atrovinosus TaxID=137266 RepID=UPI0035B53C64
MDAGPAGDALTSGECAAAVDHDQTRARALGAKAVPFHVIDGRYRISGAQSTEVFVDILRRVASER